jgi:hypothetical protein
VWNESARLYDVDAFHIRGARPWGRAGTPKATRPARALGDPRTRPVARLGVVAVEQRPQLPGTSVPARVAHRALSTPAREPATASADRPCPRAPRAGCCARMTGVEHQTVRLAAGKHRSPRHGVCVMELASMLTDDRFTDHPRRVCPVLAAFLRGYNDTVGDRRRRDLLALAADVVDSRTPDTATRALREDALQRWALDVWSARRLGLGCPPLFPPEVAFAHLEALGEYVGRRARRDAGVHARTLGLVRELAARPGDGAPAPAAAPRAAVPA